MNDAECMNCGYAFLNESMMVSRTFHACPKCGHHLDPPVTVGMTDESTDAARPYKSIVETKDD
jgi:predicted  nucleic acid-binding Zn-ribbon protein